MRWLVAAALAIGVASFGADRASAEIVVSINKATQRMAVLVDGVEQHQWMVSTGTGGGPRAGTYKPQRMERKWFSRKYNMSPMPHAIFFHEGYAIHGTIYVSRLGSRASHGCVRLHPDNAAQLFALVQSKGMGRTTIVISNTELVAGKPPAPKVEAAAAVPAARVEATAMPKAEPAVLVTTGQGIAPTDPVEPLVSPLPAAEPESVGTISAPPAEAPQFEE